MVPLCPGWETPDQGCRHFPVYLRRIKTLDMKTNRTAASYFITHAITLRPQFCVNWDIMFMAFVSSATDQWWIMKDWLYQLLSLENSNDMQHISCSQSNARLWRVSGVLEVQTSKLQPRHRRSATGLAHTGALNHQLEHNNVFYDSTAMWGSLQSALSAVRLRTALADSRARCQLLCLRVNHLPPDTTVRHAGIYSD
jgi:hypothetical protein